MLVRVSFGFDCVLARQVLTVVKPRGWTSTPRVAMYFFSNSPVKWRLTKVVYNISAFVSSYSALLRPIETY